MYLSCEAVGVNTSEPIIPEVSKMRVECRGSEIVQGVLTDGLMVVVQSSRVIA